MALIPTISLEQWRALVAVVDDGSYAAAAEAIHKSQSAVTYAVQQVEKLLGVKAFRLEGRKAVLTPTGRMLYTRARFSSTRPRASNERRNVTPPGGRPRSRSPSRSSFPPG